MILECPACHTRYLVQIGLFAQGGRQVRCARCKHEWHAKLPTSIDVVSLPPDFPPIPVVPEGKTFESSTFFASDRLHGQVNPPPLSDTTGQLPAVIKKRDWRKWVSTIVLWLMIGALSLVWPIMGRETIVKVFPLLRVVYDAVGLHVPPLWAGLTFERVTSELRYDSGTMKLFVNGLVHNTTEEVQFIPDIRARAIGPDKHIIQSWWIEAPAATIAPDGDVPFHTEVATPMEHTIEDVYLEFYARDDKADVAK